MDDYRQADSTRGYLLYRYLLGRLAISRSNKGAPNNQQTARRVGDNNLRKIISAVLADEETWHQTVSLKSRDAGLTTGRVAEMLGELKASLAAEYRAYDLDYSRVLTANDILVALYHLTELAPDERSRLGLPVGDKLTLLKQTLLSLQLKDGSANYESIFKAYKEAVGLEFTSSEKALENLNQVNDLIEHSVRAALQHLPDRPRRFHKQRSEPSSEDIIQELSRKAQREVRRLLVRSGNTQVFLVDNETKHPFISHYLPPAFIQKFSKTIVSNERLTAQLPVHLKQITIEARGPLPFTDTSIGSHQYRNTYPRLLDPYLQELDGHVEHALIDEIPSPSDYELASQGVTKLTLSFYIKIDNDYESVVPDVFSTLASSTEQPYPYRRVDFDYSSTGIGGTLSHIIKVINTTLIQDIACLSRFFPIVRDVASTQTIIRDNVSSPIWAHSLVKLCHNRAVGQALWVYEDNKPSSSEEFSFGDPIGQGDFCGFDFFIAQAQSAVQARLQAILNTGINPTDYIQQLCEKVERQLTLKRARQTLTYYPFSSMGMIGIIHQKVLKDKFKHRALCSTDAGVYYDAFLSITEAFLDEGAYRAAYHNLKKLELLDTYAVQSLAPKNSANIDINSCEVFSSQLIIRYLLCKATYYYLYDLNGPIDEHIQREFSAQVTRQQLVKKTWHILESAQEHVKARLKKYLVVGEVSQGTFSPHYKLLSRIYLLRARLLTFFPRMVPNAESYLPTENFSRQQRTKASVHWGKLYLLEKARLYIAAEGDGESYAYYAALQSCYYLTAAYTDPQQLILSEQEAGKTHSFDRDHCLSRAKRLKDHALLAYARTGRLCYNAIKEKSGQPEEFDEYGRYFIEKLPAIFEARGRHRGRKVSDNNEFLTLDISLLAIKPETLSHITTNPPSKTIYLFGTNACHIFLARGLYLLCSNDNEEFRRSSAPEDPVDWPSKLELAGRLFDLAWAIAEDGCGLARDEVDPQKKSITRSFKTGTHRSQYTSREIDSVRDLYPRRVSEVADIGKIFSAACMVLKLKLLPETDRLPLLEDMNKLISMIHGEYRFEKKRLLQEIFLEQSRYNGHLEHFLSSAQVALRAHLPNSAAPATSKEMYGHRDELMKALFSTLLNES
ncbi:MAG: hypothetical protein AAF703_09970 [Cyanobacteria bacterium P01_D01_bin.105]